MKGQTDWLQSGWCGRILVTNHLYSGIVEVAIQWSIMATNEEAPQCIEDYVYRISTAEEWKEIERTGCTFGRELDKVSSFIHLSKIDQVPLSPFLFVVYTLSILYIPESCL